MFIATILLSAVLALAFFGAGASKLANAAQSISQRDELGVSAQRWRVIGVLELAGAAGVLVGLGVVPLGLAAAGGLGVLMIGAIGTHLRAKDAAHVAPSVVLALLAIATVVVRAGSA